MNFQVVLKFVIYVTIYVHVVFAYTVTPRYTSSQYYNTHRQVDDKNSYAEDYNRQAKLYSKRSRLHDVAEVPEAQSDYYNADRYHTIQQSRHYDDRYDQLGNSDLIDYQQQQQQQQRRDSTRNLMDRFSSPSNTINSSPNRLPQNPFIYSSPNLDLNSVHSTNNLIRKCLITNIFDDCHEFVEIGSKLQYQNILSKNTQGFSNTIQNRGSSSAAAVRQQQHQIRKCAITGKLEDCNQFVSITYTDSTAVAPTSSLQFDSQYLAGTSGLVGNQNQIFSNYDSMNSAGDQYKIRKCVITGNIEDCSSYVTILNFSPIQQQGGDVVNSYFSGQQNNLETFSRQPNFGSSSSINGVVQPHLIRKCLITNRQQDCHEFLEITDNLQEGGQQQVDTEYYQRQQTIRKCAITEKPEDCDKFTVITYSSLMGENQKPLNQQTSINSGGRHQLRKCVITNKLSDCDKFIEVDYNLFEDNIDTRNPKNYRIQKCALTNRMEDCGEYVQVVRRPEDINVGDPYQEQQIEQQHEENRFYKRHHVPNIQRIGGSYNTRRYDDSSLLHPQPSVNRKLRHDDTEFPEREGINLYPNQDSYISTSARRIRKCDMVNGVKQCYEEDINPDLNENIIYPRQERYPQYGYEEQKRNSIQHYERINKKSIYRDRQEEEEEAIRDESRYQRPSSSSYLNHDEQRRYVQRKPQNRADIDNLSNDQNLAGVDRSSYDYPRQQIPSQLDSLKSGQNKVRNCKIINGIEECREYQEPKYYNLHKKEMSPYDNGYNQYPNRNSEINSHEYENNPRNRDYTLNSNEYERSQNQLRYSEKSRYDETYKKPEERTRPNYQSAITSNKERPIYDDDNIEDDTNYEYVGNGGKYSFRGQIKENSRNVASDNTKHPEDRKSKSYDDNKYVGQQQDESSLDSDYQDHADQTDDVYSSSYRNLQSFQTPNSVVEKQQQIYPQRDDVNRLYSSRKNLENTENLQSSQYIDGKGIYMENRNIDYPHKDNRDLIEISPQKYSNKKQSTHTIKKTVRLEHQPTHESLNYENGNAFLLDDVASNKTLPEISSYYNEIRYNSRGEPEIVMCIIRNGIKDCHQFVQASKAKRQTDAEKLNCNCRDGLKCQCDSSQDSNITNKDDFHCQCDDFQRYIHTNGSSTVLCQCIRDFENNNTLTCNCRKNSGTNETRFLNCQGSNDSSNSILDGHHLFNEPQQKPFDCGCSNSTYGLKCDCNNKKSSDLIGNKSVGCWCSKDESQKGIKCNCSKDIQQLGYLTTTSNLKGIWCECRIIENSNKNMTNTASLLCPCTFKTTNNASVDYQAFVLSNASMKMSLPPTISRTQNFTQSHGGDSRRSNEVTEIPKIDVRQKPVQSSSNQVKTQLKKNQIKETSHQTTASPKDSGGIITNIMKAIF